MSLTISEASSDNELAEVAKFGVPFYEEAKLPGRFVPEVFQKSWRSFIDLTVGTIFLLRRDGRLIGVLGAMKYTDPNNGDPVATEMFWFVDKAERGSGLLLFKRYEEWARGLGIERITMMHLDTVAANTLSALYLRRGYSELETHYVKTL